MTSDEKRWRLCRLAAAGGTLASSSLDWTRCREPAGGGLANSDHWAPNHRVVRIPTALSMALYGTSRYARDRSRTDMPVTATDFLATSAFAAAQCGRS